MSRDLTRAVPLLLAMAALLFCTGCPTTPKREAPVMEVPRSAPVTPSFEWKAAPPAPAVQLPTQPAVQTPALPVVSLPRAEEDSDHDLDAAPAEMEPEPVNEIPPGAISFAEWSQQAGYGAPIVRTDQGVMSAMLQTPQGKLEIRAGDRFAKWNNLLVGLGFAPVVQKGRLMVDSLDIGKNFQPLINSKFQVQRLNRVVVIDPGHGGQNAGARSVPANAWEKDLTMDWALRVERLLKGSDWHVILTRRDDRDVSLLERAAIADSVEADLFISLHFNSAGGKKGTSPQEGLETYCLTPTGMPSNLIREFGDDTTRILWNNIFDAENLLLGIKLHESLIKTTGRKDRGVRRARFMTVLQEQRRPAVLLEGGFLSHPQEGRLIGTPEFREALAKGVVNALKSF